MSRVANYRRGIFGDFFHKAAGSTPSPSIEKLGRQKVHCRKGLYDIKKLFYRRRGGGPPLLCLFRDFAKKCPRIHFRVP